jgi:hypothetical protein
MSTGNTQIAAVTCCYFMRRYSFAPATIINCGIGRTCPELAIWQWLLPESKLLGIDPRWSPKGAWTRGAGLPQVKCALGTEDATGVLYCGVCLSLKCPEARAHGRSSVVNVRTLDSIVQEHQLAPPYFLWIDIDGSEPDALAGARDTLKQTGWLNVEVDSQRWGEAHATKIEKLLAESGFTLHYRHGDSDDRLYRNRRLKN